jgi:hypothetical protein
MWSDRSLPTFRGKVLPPYAGYVEDGGIRSSKTSITSEIFIVTTVKTSLNLACCYIYFHHRSPFSVTQLNISIVKPSASVIGVSPKRFLFLQLICILTYVYQASACWLIGLWTSSDMAGLPRSIKAVFLRSFLSKVHEFQWNKNPKMKFTLWRARGFESRSSTTTVSLLNFNKYSLRNSQLRTSYGSYLVMLITKDQISIKGSYRISYKRMSTLVHLIVEPLNLQLSKILNPQFQDCLLLARLTFHPWK